MAASLRTLIVRKNSSLKTIIFPQISNTYRFSSSALYVPGNKANKTFSYLTPQLDCDERLADPQKLQQELNLRGLNINVEDLQKSWEYYQLIISNRLALEKKEDELQNRMREVMKNPESSDTSSEMEAMKTQIRLLRQDMRVIKETIWDLEDTVIPRVLKLPNVIDKETPPDTPFVLKSVRAKPKFHATKNHNHLDIGKNLGLLDFINPIQYYLNNEAAFFELKALALAARILNDLDIKRIAGPDFCRSLVMEGCGIDHESPAATFILQNMDDVEKEFLVNRLHLIGGASLPAMFAMYTKQVLKPKSLPAKVFSTGRQYTPVQDIPGAYGLFSTCQASVVQALIFTENKDEQYESEFQNLVDAATRIYEEIGSHYRVVLRSAGELGQAEGRRVSFEMWSVHLNRYIEVGHVSSCGDYISKRLLFAYRVPSKAGFPAAITGTLLSVPRVLGCLLEENPDEFMLADDVDLF